MFEKIDDIVMLINKHMKDELSSDEKQRLEDWANESVANRHFLDEILNENELTKTILDFHNIKINKRLHQSIETRTRVEQQRGKAQRGLYMAAASILLIVIVGSVYMLTTRTGTKTSAAKTLEIVTAGEIAPAGNKAILTLSNGSKISLSDAGDGLIAEDGNTAINKKQDGQLIYKSNKQQRDQSLVYNTVSTPRGGKFQVTLPDGSKVWLNAATEIRFPVAFSDKDRRITLDGEAYLEIVTDRSRPFKVVIDKPGYRQEIEVLGTHFNVNAYLEERQINTTLLEGRIKVTSNSRKCNNLYRILQAGQRATFDSTMNNVNVIASRNPRSAIGWVNGHFSCDKTSLASLMRELSRWYDVDVRYEGADLESKSITGDIDRKMPLSKLLSKLEKMLPVKLSLEDRTIVVKPG
jgi:transmembrane sensor